MGEEQGWGQRFRQEVRCHRSGRDVEQDHYSIGDEPSDVVVTDVDVARLTSDLGGFRQFDSRAVVFQDDSGCQLGKAIGIEEVPEMRNPAAATGEA